jgi:hypothetical protein
MTASAAIASNRYLILNGRRRGGPADVIWPNVARLLSEVAG